MMEFVIEKTDTPVKKPAPLSERQPGQLRAVVGGVDYSVGGWGEYEINRRRARWEASGRRKQGGGSGGAAPEEAAPSANPDYPGRTFVGGHDAARSILAGARSCVGGGGGPAADGAPRSAVQKAALRLATVLGRLEDRLCDPDDEGVWECASAIELREEKQTPAKALTIPPITSADLRAFAEDPAQEADPDAIYDLAEDVTSLTAAAGKGALAPLPALANRASLPPLPSRFVQVTDEEGILRLEAAAAPYVAGIEALQAALATHLDKAASALESSLSAP